MSFICSKCNKPVESWQVTKDPAYPRDREVAVVRCHGETERILILHGCQRDQNIVAIVKLDELGTSKKSIVAFETET